MLNQELKRNKIQTSKGLNERVNLLCWCLSSKEPSMESVKQINLLDSADSSLPYLAGSMIHKKSKGRAQNLTKLLLDTGSECNILKIDQFCQAQQSPSLSLTGLS